MCWMRSAPSGKAVLASKHVSFTGLPPSEPDTAGQPNGSSTPQDRGSAAHPTPTSGPATAAATAAPAPSTAPGSGPGGGEGDAEGEAEEGPQRYESEVVTNSESGDIVFKSKSKMMLFKKEEGKPPSWDTRGGKVRYIANLPKSMQVIVNEARKMATWSAPCQLEDMSAAVTLQNVGMILPKSMLQDFNNQIKALQAKMAA
ncbi:uncharacterized protein HaLaN_05088 [Haematococcus lacustris]|uniref:Uncharacterized protein n=1 Tax=Haematococcus lacustris TaxID=44745 RepID=A0A699YKP4_HAELA|nr:uncharacterized protein HaLaN_05088 [Haematococcus lacustris]